MGVIRVSIIMGPEMGTNIEAPMRLEAVSSPPGGELTISYEHGSGSLDIEMFSEDLSTLRAMLNSYLGLVSTAVRTASD
jgi:tRNA threonylcarbamoyladenosine modification (KEOPS) complex  Pcc1 subunit